MNIYSFSLSFGLIFLIFLAACTQKQPEEPDPIRRKSPTAIASIKHKNTYVKVVYGQPYRKGRKIFGELIPYGKVWRTGANEATELTTTGPLRINGKNLKEGTYALFSIPGEESWTIIFNAELGQWGAFEYNTEKDILRTEVPVTQMNKTTNVFTIRFDEVVNDSTLMIIEWEQTQVRIPITFFQSGPATP